MRMRSDNTAEMGFRQALTGSLSHPGGWEGAKAAASQTAAEMKDGLAIAKAPGALSTFIGGCVMLKAMGEGLSQFGDEQSRAALMTHVRTNMSQAGEALQAAPSDDTSRLHNIRRTTGRTFNHAGKHFETYTKGVKTATRLAHFMVSNQSKTNK